jgi:hypothetical protein
MVFDIEAAYGTRFTIAVATQLSAAAAVAPGAY